MESSSRFLTFSEVVIKQEEKEKAADDDSSTGNKFVELFHVMKQEPEVDFVCVLPDIKGHGEFLRGKNRRKDGGGEKTAKINKGKVELKKAELNIDKSE